ncbi:MAG: hypothetical protein AAF456_07115 [Planctomycetota bacterium]
MSVFRTPLSSGIIFCTLVFVCLPATSASGQEREEREGIFESREQYFEFMGELREIDNPELKELIPVLNDVIMASHGLKDESYGTPFRGERAWMTRMLEHEVVRNEIDMLDYQYEDLQNAGRDIQRRMESQIRDALRQHTSGAVNAEQFLEQVNAIRRRSEQEMDDTLLPHQQDRLRQVLMRTRLSRESPADLLGSDALAEQLGIDDAQKEELSEQWQIIQRRLSDDIARLREEARQELIDQLEPDQRAKFDEIFGDNFSWRSGDRDSQRGERDREERESNEREERSDRR